MQPADFKVLNQNKSRQSEKSQAGKKEQGQRNQTT